jgi:hypothetical protein
LSMPSANAMSQISDSLTQYQVRPVHTCCHSIHPKLSYKHRRWRLLSDMLVFVWSSLGT